MHSNALFKKTKQKTPNFFRVLYLGFQNNTYSIFLKTFLQIPLHFWSGPLDCSILQVIMLS